METDAQAAYLAAAAKLLGLPIPPEQQEAVRAAFAVLCQQAELVTSFAPPPGTEAAPRYRP
ncbi:AtzG-like protein [Acidocella sp.]|uniref:AtzG-like protein n=1 Tax=Acidocella sp. TaxID=50710 RepID=UPI003D0922AF